jgi:hypothetical protein
VLRRIASSASSSPETFMPAMRLPLMSLKENSLKLVERDPMPADVSRDSNSWSCDIKVALISRSGLRELRNSNVLINDQRYFRIR